MLMSNHKIDPSGVDLVRQDCNLVVREAPPILAHFPFQISGIVCQDYASRVFLEFAFAWIELPGRLFKNASEFLLAGGAILSCI